MAEGAEEEEGDDKGEEDTSGNLEREGVVVDSWHRKGSEDDVRLRLDLVLALTNPEEISM